MPPPGPATPEKYRLARGMYGLSFSSMRNSRKSLITRIIGIVLSLPATPTWAIPLKAHVCEAYLSHVPIPLASNHFAMTSSVIKNFRNFRLYTLGEHDVNPSTKSVALDSSKRTARRQKQAAQRIRGLEVFAQADDGENAESTNLSWGMTLHGRKEIEEFLNQVHASVELFDALWIESAYGSSGKKLDLALFATMASSPSYAFMKAPWAYMTQRSDLMLIGLALVALPVYIAIHSTGADFFYRRPLYWDFKQHAHDKALLNTLDEIERGEKAFFFDSRNDRLLPELIKTFYVGFPLSTEKIHAQDAREGRAYLAPDLPLGWFPRDDKPREFHWVGIDRLLDRDPETQEPRLSIFIRSSIKRPIFPASAKDKSPLGFGSGFKEVFR